MAVSRPAPRSVEYALDHKEYLNEILVREAEAARACEKKARQERSLEKTKTGSRRTAQACTSHGKSRRKQSPQSRKREKESEKVL